MIEFDEAKKTFLDAKTHHADLVKDLKNLIAKPPMMPKLRKIDADMIAREANSPNLMNPPPALADLDRLTWATAWLHPDNKYRSSVRKMHAEIEASEDLLAEAKRKFARAIKSQMENDAIIAAMREKIAELFWCRVTAGIQLDWRAITADLLKKPSDEELRKAKPGFLNKYGLD